MEVKMIKCETCGKLAEDTHEVLRGWCEINGQVGFRLKRARGPCKTWMGSVPVTERLAHFCSRKCLDAALDKAETGKE